jgi:apolipoprotein N-acyltransferase
MGYGLFWKGASLCTTRKESFFCALVWFGAVSVLHLNWLLADRYVGIYIYFFITFLIIGLGMQFGLITLMIGKPKDLTVLQMLGISGGWAICEWIRLFIMTGYSFDPVGIALSGTVTGMQMAAALGVYGLTFWVIFTNLLALRALSRFSWRAMALWGVVATVPYGFGWLHLTWHDQILQKESSSLKVLAVQTALAPEDKLPVNGSIPIPIVEQWRRILSFLAPYLEHHVDLIVLPEGAVPYGSHHPIYPIEIVEKIFRDVFGAETSLPPVHEKRVGNLYWAQALAHLTQAEVVLGLEDVAAEGKA